MKKVTKEYLFINPCDLIRADEHFNAFPSEEENDHEGLMLSYQKYDRLKPVYYFEDKIEDKIINKLIDGHKYVAYAIQTGFEKIFACKLTFEDSNDVTKVMVQLQRSEHDSLLALYHMIQALWPVYFRGAGYRSDLGEKELEVPTESADGGRALNIYQRIGHDINLSGNTVKHIRKVGMCNQFYFKRIETDRFSLYQAYLAVIAEERGEESQVPAVKEPVYVSTSTGAPAFTEASTTEPRETGIPGEPEAANNNDATVNATESTPEGDAELTPVKVTCPHCGITFNYLISKNKKP